MCGPFTSRPSVQSSPALPHLDEHHAFEQGHFQMKPDFHSFTDKTSMASLSRLPARRMRTRKQRELDYENDLGEDFWLQDGLMFNVPMSPALYMQQKQRKSRPSFSTPQGPKSSNGHHNRQKSADKSDNHGQRKPQNGPHDPQSKPPRLPQPSNRRKSATRNSNATLPSIKETDSQNSTRTAAYHDMSVSSEDLSLASMLDHSLNFDYAQEVSFTSPLSVKSRSASLPCLNTDLPPPSPIMSSSSSPRRTSLTRPEHLPPKTPDEEKKHLDEYGKIMAMAAEHEKKRQSAEEAKAQARTNQMHADIDVWQAWLKNPTSASKRLRQLWWRGIPQRVRGDVWISQVGNSLEVTLEGCTLSGNEAAIVQDSAHVWPELGIFQPDRPLHRSLILIVRSFLGLHPGLKYQRALSLIAGLLLLELDEEKALVVMANMLHKSLPLAVMMGDEQTATAHYTPYYKVFRAKFGRLNDHFNSIRMAPNHYLDSMISNMFTDRLDVDTAAHIIDVFLFEGDGFLLQAALGLVRSNEASLYQSRNEVIEALEAKITISDEALFDHISHSTR